MDVRGAEVSVDAGVGEPEAQVDHCLVVHEFSTKDPISSYRTNHCVNKKITFTLKYRVSPQSRTEPNPTRNMNQRRTMETTQMRAYMSRRIIPNLREVQPSPHTTIPREVFN